MILEYLTDDIFYGIKIMDTHLSINEKDYLYLSGDNIQNGKIDKSNSFFVSKKVVNKYYKRTLKTITYGDYVIVKRGEKFCIERIEETDVMIIPNNEIIAFKGTLGYFDNAVRDQSKRKYLYEKLNILSDKYKGKGLIEKIKDIDFKVQGLIVSEEPEKFEKYEREALDPSSIKITDTKMPIQNIVRRIRLKKINMLTEFQREGNLWNVKAQSRLIESIIIGFPIPSFYFDCSNDSSWLIIDGLQRLSTLENFIIKERVKDDDDEYVFRLQDLEYLPEYNGKTFSELPTEIQFQIEDYNIRVLRIEEGTPQRVKYSLFERINTVGLVLKPQEIRHALNQANPKKPERNPAEFIKGLSELPLFREFWGRRHKNRMQDREAILRYVTFKIYHYKKYRPDMKEFLDNGMTEIYDVSDSYLDDIKHEFVKALELVKFIWNRDFSRAFALDSRTFNSPLFEITSYHFSLLDDSEVSVLRRKKFSFLDKYNELIEDEDFKVTISTDNQKTIQAVQYRFEKFGQMLNEVINDK